MKCAVCSGRIKVGTLLVPVYKTFDMGRHGMSVPSHPEAWAHLDCVTL